MCCLASFTPIGTHARSHGRPSPRSQPSPPAPSPLQARGVCWESGCRFGAPRRVSVGTELIGVGITGVPSGVGTRHCPGPPTKHQG